MARYIDADKLCKGLEEMARLQPPFKQSTILGVVSTIKNTPTADVVKVTRCKNCIHYQADIVTKGVGWCYKIDRGSGENSFCSEGWEERRENGKV